jgi:hypothetical protein
VDAALRDERDAPKHERPKGRSTEQFAVAAAFFLSNKSLLHTEN